MQVSLDDITSDIEYKLEKYGKKCTGLEPKDDSNFIRNLIKNDHTSVLEHAKATFIISGISRACSHQLVRHRIASFTQRSQRYCVEKGAKVSIPESIVNSKKDEVMEEFLIAIAHSQHGYKRLLELGVKPEDARYVLPEATTTEIVVTMNMRSLRNFFQLRLSRHAQAEIRFLAEMMLTNVYKHAPNVFFDIVDKHIEQELKYGRSIRCYFDGSGTTDTVG